MLKQIKIISQIIIIVLIASALGYYGYLDYQKGKIVEDPEKEAIERIINLTFIKQDLGDGQKTQYQESFVRYIEVFLKDPESIEAFWPLIGIAQVKELVGDYTGAKEALLWAIELQPQSYVAHGNLANIYFRQDNNFAKAEEHFLKAIEPDNEKTINYYFELHEIYRHFYKQDANLAEDILKQGIEKYPKATDLMAVLAHYYKDSNRKDDAKEYYQKMLEINPDSQVAKQGLKDL